MSPRPLKSCFIGASALGYCCTILLSMQNVYSSKCLISRHRYVPHLGYDTHVLLFSLKFRTFLSVRAQYCRLCPISGRFRYNGSLVTWTVVCFTAPTFKPLIFSVTGLALSNDASIFVIMVLYDFSMLRHKFVV
jgi:hypothetical protein